MPWRALGKWDSGGNFPFLNATLRHQALREPLTISFMIDTGCNQVVIAPRDAQRMATLGLKIAGLPIAPPVRTLGGVVPVGRLDEPVLFFLDIDTAIVRVPLDLALVCRLPQEGEGPEGVDPYQFSSVLGTSFLRYFKFFMDNARGRVELTNNNYPITFQ